MLFIHNLKYKNDKLNKRIDELVLQCESNEKTISALKTEISRLKIENTTIKNRLSEVLELAYNNKKK